MTPARPAVQVGTASSRPCSSTMTSGVRLSVRTSSIPWQVGWRSGWGGRDPPCSRLCTHAGGWRLVSQGGTRSVLGTGGHVLRSSLKGNKQRKLCFLSSIPATSTLIGKNDRHPKQPPSSRINSVNFAVSTVWASFTDSRDAGKVMTRRRMILRHPTARVPSQSLGFLISVLLVFKKNMQLAYPS